MNSNLLAAFVVFFYGMATLFQYVDLRNDQKRYAPWLLLIAVVALVEHAWLLHHWIDLGRGQNLSFFNMFSLLCWLVSLLVILLSLFQDVAALLLLMLPLAAVSVIAAALFPSFNLVETATNPLVLLHVLLAVLSFGVLCIAGLQAIILIVVERMVRTRSALGFKWRTPPLQSMEHLLFQSIWLGFMLLSLVLLSSVYTYHAKLLQQPALLQKTILASLAWAVFAMLLVGRKLWGWRGRRVTFGSLGGISVLVVAYLTAKFIWKV